MKRILLSCFVLLAITSVTAFAQSKHTYKSVPVAPKSLFSAQITRFDNFVSASNVTAANKVIDSMILEMNDEVRYSQYFMNDDSVAKSGGLAAANTHVQAKQKSLMSVNYMKSNVTANKTSIDTELAKFIALWD